jgi:GH18 family chitinase
LSFALKGSYILSAGLKGFIMWEAGGDYKDALLDSICKFNRSSTLVEVYVPV